MILAIDTSQHIYSIATSTGLYVAWEDINITISSQIPQNTLSKITGIIINIGPGRYSGIRSGIAFTLGLARAKQIPIYVVSSLQLCASATKHKTRINIALDARKNQAYFQTFDQQAPVSEITLINQSQLQDIAAVLPTYGSVSHTIPTITSAKTMIDYFEQASLHPTSPENIKAIYIRSAVD
ncbi:MAG: tRNA (adenosine(37)-N6)-threonylcarbamoyltransferase complex dimerization subunit type 1 TsaB [Pseudomonadota bacterium]|nr:tRNA (adenosine(37)-N6)-threonylcarbamoyltransferase complex dimerization subunit type 1 TsaB [Pseudomonadota bacterium]